MLSNKLTNTILTNVLRTLQNTSKYILTDNQFKVITDIKHNSIMSPENC